MAKTTLTVTIQYDPRKTHPDGLASAMDQLLKTALSVPEVMAEYGDPKIGKFFVARAGSIQGHRYVLRIDGSLLRKQRLLLLALSESASKGTLNIPQAHATDLLEGVVSLLDEISDQAHDRHGIDCLLDADEPKNRPKPPEPPAL